MGILEMQLINFEVNLILPWSKKCVITNTAANQDTKITDTITDTKRYVPVVTLSPQDNTKLFQQIKSGFNTQLPEISINQKQQHKMLQTNI